MSRPQFTKHYRTPERTAAAVRHYRWINQHAKPLRQPGLSVIGPVSLTFERVEGRPVRPEDLPRMAKLLGHAHGAAWCSDLQSALLSTPHRFQDGTAFDDYLGPREVALRRRHEQGYLPDKTSLYAMLGLLEETAQGPSAFYKDSNPRNFIVTRAGDIVTVDTDDLSLAPMGYDLAKLIAALHLTYGPLTDQTINSALFTYNGAARCYGARLGTTDRERLDDFLALHAVLTAPYVGRNDYHYSWPLRPRPRGTS
ncbi:phosphotransferase [Streptomyces sp. NBC_01221]|uniref:phosphotransferase n=1 Tax=Streptomyces sp. NBC_01221 TaxID=2903782 RepID=UPI00224DA191|nr:phosphotransferase [Streptomyces sp. NBC_01221]MCX4785419.1 phosphotransferase [Streptomyces sp. NBC_01221]